MRTITRTARDRDGHVGITSVSIYDATGTSLVPLYDQTGTLITNPITTDAFGMYSVQLPNGQYIAKTLFRGVHYAEPFAVYDHASEDAQKLFKESAFGSLQQWHIVPVQGVKAGTTVTFDWTLGQHQYYILEEPGLVITPLNIPQDGELTIELINADINPPDYSQLTDIADGVIDLATKSVVHLKVQSVFDGSLKTSQGYWWDAGPVFFGEIGLFAGDAYTLTVDAITLSTPSDAQVFGNLMVMRTGNTAVSNGTLALVAASGSYSATIEQLVFDTPADATYFGDMYFGRRNCAGVSDGEKALFGAGYSGGYTTNVEVDLFDVPGTGAIFGSLNVLRESLTAAGDGTYALFAGGTRSGVYDHIEMLTFAGDVAASTIGTLTTPRKGLAAVSDGSIAVFGGGADTGGVTTLDQTVIANLSNATTFSSLSTPRYYIAAANNDTIGVFAGGYQDPAPGLDSCEYIQIAVPGPGAAFGNLTVGRFNFGGCSGG